MSEPHNLKELLEYLKSNPHEVERFEQCFNCGKLSTCNEEDCDDENGMCKNYISLSH